LIDYNDNNNDTDLWNYVIKTTKKIDPNNNTKHYKNTLSKKNKEIALTSKIKFHNIYQTKDKNLTVKPIHFSKEKNSSGLSKKNIRELNSGKFKVQSKLDLHGYKLKEAENLFFEFLHKSFNSNKRNVLVVSGKGENGKGKIKLSIPVWITSSNLSPLIYFYSFAAPKDGGSGAFYIRLRKNSILK
jgi:DNA-nicking Smr family endonuclease